MIELENITKTYKISKRNAGIKRKELFATCDREFFFCLQKQLHDSHTAIKKSRSTEESNCKSVKNMIK